MLRKTRQYCGTTLFKWQNHQRKAQRCETWQQTEKDSCFQHESWNKEVEYHPVPSQLGMGKLKFFVTLCMSPNDHKSTSMNTDLRGYKEMSASGQIMRMDCIFHFSLQSPLSVPSGLSSFALCSGAWCPRTAGLHAGLPVLWVLAGSANGRPSGTLGIR